MSDQQSLRDELFKLAMQKKWGEVVKKFKDTREAHRIELTKSEDTAFHIAISCYNSKLSPNTIHERSTMEMIDVMKDGKSLKEVLRMRNAKGDTPLHLAAAVGWEVICDKIASEERKQKEEKVRAEEEEVEKEEEEEEKEEEEEEEELIAIRNEKGETPLFIAAHHGNLDAFLKLHDICVGKNQNPDESLCRRKDGNTVLHSAISGEYFRLAYFIIKRYKNLVNYVNVDGETPLHVLARMPTIFRSSSILGFYESIIYQFVFVDDLKQPRHNRRAIKNGSDRDLFPKNYQTCVNFFNLLWDPIYMSCIAGNRRKNLSTRGENPQHVEYGVPISEKFFDCHSRSKKKNAIPTEENDVENQTGSSWSKNQRSPSNAVQNQPYVEYDVPTSANFLDCCSRSKKQNGLPAEENAENQNKSATEAIKYRGSFPPNYTTCISIFKVATKVVLTVLGIGFLKIRKIQEKKVKHCHAMEILNEMVVDSEPSYKYDSNGQRPDKEFKPQRLVNIPDKPPLVEENEIHQSPEGKDQQKDDNKEDQNQSGGKKANGVVKDTPVLVAAKMGIPEMVKKILFAAPVAIQDQDSEGKNVLMLAAEHRHTNVFEYLMQSSPPDHVFHLVDNEGNNILHLAAKLGLKQPWRIPGAALQMQWEIKWYKHVKDSVPPLCFSHHNANGETPRQIFSRTHENLLKSGNEWLIKTSESCSVVAALIATVAFATAATVPGGLDQNNGYPMLRNHEAFDIFSIASLLALCLSITALVFFLAIITSRFEERDFKRNLPRKLLMGLSCLFSSISAMLLSFCAGHTFILREKLKIAAVPIYAATALPVTLFAVAQLPLYFDLLWAAYIKVPLRSYKVFHQ